jgi:hypothetical protein
MESYEIILGLLIVFVCGIKLTFPFRAGGLPNSLELALS